MDDSGTPLLSLKLGILYHFLEMYIMSEELYRKEKNPEKLRCKTEVTSEIHLKSNEETKNEEKLKSEEELKREKNRLAAQRCRQKQAQRIEYLEKVHFTVMLGCIHCFYQFFYLSDVCISKFLSGINRAHFSEEYQENRAIFINLQFRFYILSY